MVFKRFFDRSAEQETNAPPADTPAEDEAEDSGAPEEAETEELGETWPDRAARVLPAGASTGSKRPVALYGAERPDAPTHFVSASGCRLTTPAGATYVDLSMRLRAVPCGSPERKA